MIFYLYPKFALDIGTFDEDMFDLSNVPLNGDIELIYEVNGFTITYEFFIKYIITYW